MSSQLIPSKLNCLIMISLVEKSTLKLNSDNIPDLHWELATIANTITVATDSYSTPITDLISVKTFTNSVPIVVC